uniref:Uncharacterized protein n=1 Tax=Oryza glumipatula TaxID=40148 RepID=A0A0D9ZKR7_9ORYZ
MVEGMSEHVVDEGPSDVVVVDGSIEMKRSSVDDGKIDKLINLIEVLVSARLGLRRRRRVEWRWQRRRELQLGEGER